MNLKNIIYLYAFILIADLNAEVNISNQVDNDHRIRNFAFSGPFQHDVNMDSLSRIINAKHYSFTFSL